MLRNAVRLQHVPVFLFSSGPLGDSEHVAIDFAKIDELRAARSMPSSTTCSPGRLERSELGRIERWIVDVVRAHDGDFREWNAIDAWAAEVAAHLSSTTSDAV